MICLLAKICQISIISQNLFVYTRPHTCVAGKLKSDFFSGSNLLIYENEKLGIGVDFCFHVRLFLETLRHASLSSLHCYIFRLHS